MKSARTLLEMGLITPNTIVDDVPYQKMGGESLAGERGWVL